MSSHAQSITHRPASNAPVGLLALCRPGFEPECAGELEYWLQARGGQGHGVYDKASGLVTWHGDSSVWPVSQALVFSRQVIPLRLAKPIKLAVDDRINPILQALAGQQVSAIYLDHPDTNEGKSLAKLLDKIQRPLLSAAGKAGILDRAAKARAHLVFTEGLSAWLGSSEPGQTLRWPMGIPRLKMPAEAPSRSTLKLAEAFAFFMSAEEQQEWLREGLTAVDLGACPGGWTWQLVQRGIQVTAIDNGPMHDKLMASGLVEHLLQDGFVYRPTRPVHWLVCDMVEQPTRVAALVGDWLAEGQAQHAMFNLKLPMKTRLQTVEQCRQMIEQRLAQAQVKLQRLAFRQLYHDREEVTGYAVVA